MGREDVEKWWRGGGAGSREMRPNGTGVVRSSGRRKVVDQDKPRRKEKGASSKNEKETGMVLKRAEAVLSS